MKADSSIRQYPPTPLGALLGHWRLTDDTLAIQWHSIETAMQVVPAEGFPLTQLTARLKGNELVLHLSSDSLTAVYKRVGSSTGSTSP